MDEKIKQLKQSFIIPEDLDQIVRKAIDEGNRGRKRRVFIRKSILSVAASFMMFVLVLGVGINTNQVFAETVQNIPVVRTIAKIMTFRTYDIVNESLNAHVDTPEVEGLSDKMLEAKINSQIQERLEESLLEIQIRAEEYKEAYFATGGNEDGYSPIEAEVGYEVKFSSEENLSFVVYQYETLASAYTQYTYYNYDLINDVELKLKDIYGEEYIDKINSSIIKTIEEMKKDPQNIFFEGDMGFVSIKEDQKFYIKNNGSVTIVFDKYEIAPGAMGMIEIEIAKLNP